MNAPTWIGILLCTVQAGVFSGLNLAVFSISRLRLEVAATSGSRDASRLLELRKDSNLTLCVILWGNVSVNVLLTLLSDSVMTGVVAFLFSTVVLTLFGEIIPQAYFSRRVPGIAARLIPMLTFYRVILYPVAKPTAKFLDWWLGPEGIPLFRERDFRALITKHVEATDADVSRVEAIGALNFLDLDDIPVLEEGEPLDPLSIITLPTAHSRPGLPKFSRSPDDPFLRQVHASDKKWVVITDASGQPQLVLEAHHFLRDALLGGDSFNPDAYWHRPIVITDEGARLGDVLGRLHVKPQHAQDDVIDQDLILVWGKQKRIITGADLLGRLLRGIVGHDPKSR